MNLATLGWNDSLAQHFANVASPDLEPARVAVEDKHHYVVFTAEGPLLCQIAGKLHYRSASPADLPKVGDWVAIARAPRENKAIIHQVLPRRTKLSRKSPGRETEEQVLVANLDVVFLVQGLDREFNSALLQRHLTMVLEGGARPVVVLNKSDLCRRITATIATTRKACADSPALAVSARTGRGLDRLWQWIRPAETVAFIGPSGAGKSSLINKLYGDEVQATTEVRESDAKGRHTTSWRELIILPNGGLVIDTPGMREFQMWRGSEGVRDAFIEIETLATQCHFRNCSHTAEKRCAVREAVEKGELAPDRLEDYFKLQKELAQVERNAARRSGRDGSRRGKRER